MAKTFLEYVTKVLSSMDSDEVVSWNDTTESVQVGLVVQRSYEVITENADLPEFYSLFQLDPVAVLSPNLVILKRPDNVDSIIWVKYDIATLAQTETNHQEVKWLPIQEFLSRTNALNTADSNVGVTTYSYNGESFMFKYRTDQRPRYYTTVDDATLIFDAYDSAVDTGGLEVSKTRCWGRLDIAWPTVISADPTDDVATELNDNFVPFVDAEFQTILLNESIALAWAELKQAVHAKAEKAVRRGMIHGKKSKFGINQDRPEIDKLPNYGRGSRGYNQVTYTKDQRSGS